MRGKPSAMKSGKKLGELASTVICGNDITSSCLYVSALAIIYRGRWGPIALLLVAAVLYLFRLIYGEVVRALPLNGGAYNALLSTTTHGVGEVGGALFGVGEGEGLVEVEAGFVGVAEAVMGEGDEEVVFAVAAGLEVFHEDEELGQGDGEVVDGGGLPFLYKGPDPCAPPAGTDRGAITGFSFERGKGSCAS